jgi:hypothetical protein
MENLTKMIKFIKYLIRSFLMDNDNFVPENYFKEEYKLNVNRTRLFCVMVLIIAGFIFGLPFFILWHDNLQVLEVNRQLELYRRLMNIGLFIIIVFIGIIIHELIHGFFAAIFNKNGFKSIKFGVIPSKGMAYCINREILKANKYIIGLLMPLIILGIIPSIISVFYGNLYLFIFGILFIIGASGDILLLIQMCKDKNECWVEDMVYGSEVKIFIYRPKKMDT